MEVTNNNGRSCFICGLVLGGLLVTIVVVPMQMICGDGRYRQELIRNHIDHTVVRRAGRVLWEANAPAEDGELLDLDRNKWPPEIAVLKPTAVLIQKEVVEIEMGGGFGHFGIAVFAQGSEGFGEEKIMEGLWYYSRE